MPFRAFSVLSPHTGRRCVLSALADWNSSPLPKRSIEDLVELGKASHKERAFQLHETLKVGLSRCAMRLSNMPFGFCNAPSIRRVTSAYVQNFKQVLDFEDKHGFGGLGSEEYHALTNGIFNQHRGTMLDVAKGVFEFNEDLNKLFGPDLELAELRHLDLIQDIERSLDEFFTNRLTLRLMISHVQALNANKTVNSDGEAMVGVVNVSTHPITILSRAYVATRFMCMRDFQMAPDLLVNGTMHDEYVLRQDVQQQHFAYVHTHLFYIFLELVKNAARASIERVQTSADRNGGRAEIPSMNVTVPEEVGIWDHERSVKLADRGTGMNRSVLGKAFSYFYSSVKARPTVAAEVSDFDRRMPLAGFGFGLPISRVMARYFAGDVDVNSIPGQGTDVYIYL
mmetsp:Transcript_72426/g.169725  ORF Transcript_72426/g.169725 Transcript_72426/m.169725 type:complete len:397 (+) Transcript_72426:84-1274(+)